MTILLENETALDIGVDYEEVAYKVVHAALNYVACPYECEINILLTDNQGIQQVNKQMRNMDVPTDVLSFPMLIFKTEGDFLVAEEDISSNFDAQSGELLLGDIMEAILQSIGYTRDITD